MPPKAAAKKPSTSKSADKKGAKGKSADKKDAGKDIGKKGTVDKGEDAEKSSFESDISKSFNGIWTPRSLRMYEVF